VRKAPCADLSELRSAFVDSSISVAGREKLLAHLAGCLPCRCEIEDLRLIRELLNRSSATPVPPPADLPRRLVDIAGADAHRPLWTRPFHQAPSPATWSLPSRRRALRVRVTATTFFVGAVLAGAGLIGYAAAPSEALSAVGDPTDDAQAAFTATLGHFPLAGDALGAVMLANAADLSSGAARVGPGPTASAGSVLSDRQARMAMQRAAAAVGAVSYSGLQSFVAVRNDEVLTADLEVEARAGQGVQVKVVSQGGQQLLRGFAPATVSSRVVDGELLALLERNYVLVGARGSVVAGRAATMVAAYRGGAVQARWWLDDKTGVLLWQESYDANGAAELSFGFTSVAVTRKAGIIEHLPPRLAVPVTDAALSLSNAGQLGAAGWTCQPELAGLSLIRVRSDRVSDPSTLHLVYSDGVGTVSVFEQRGRLDEVPSGSQWDTASGAYLRHGASSLATWQSKDRVFSVITDGSPDLLARAVAALPHERADRPSTMERIKTGWAKILADVKG
jgi:hypothetical protein